MGLFRNYGAATNGRYPAPIVFDKVPAEDHRGLDLFGFFEDFENAGELGGSNLTLAGPRSGQWKCTVDTTGTITDAGLVGGVVLFTPHTDDNDACEAQTAACFTPAAGTMIAAGARIKLSDADKATWFVGLAAADTSVSQSLPNNHMGFYANGALSILCKADKAATASSTDSTIDMVDDTFINLELIVDELASLKFYINGVLVVTEVTANIPVVVTALSLATSQATGPSNMYIDWAYAYSWVK